MRPIDKLREQFILDAIALVNAIRTHGDNVSIKETRAFRETEQSKDEYIAAVTAVLAE